MIRLEKPIGFTTATSIVNGTGIYANSIELFSATGNIGSLCIADRAEVLPLLLRAFGRSSNPNPKNPHRSALSVPLFGQVH